MNRRPIITLLCLLSSIAVQIHSQQIADSIFATYFARSQAYADAYPREKAYLHLDNTSYYIGDTIWYKAYVVTAEQNQPSPINQYPTLCRTIRPTRKYCRTTNYTVAGWRRRRTIHTDKSLILRFL